MKLLCVMAECKAASCWSVCCTFPTHWLAFLSVLQGIYRSQAAFLLGERVPKNDLATVIQCLERVSVGDTHTHIHTHTRKHTCTHTNNCPHVHTHKQLPTRAHTQTIAHTCTHTNNCPLVHTDTYIHTLTFTRMCACVHQ